VPGNPAKTINIQHSEHFESQFGVETPLPKAKRYTRRDIRPEAMIIAGATAPAMRLASIRSISSESRACSLATIGTESRRCGICPIGSEPQLQDIHAITRSARTS